MSKGNRGEAESLSKGSKRGEKGRARASRKHAKWRLLFRIAAPVLAIGAFGFGVLLAYAALTLPPLSGIGQATGTIRILDRNGSDIAEVGYDAHPVTTVHLNQIAPLLQEATISAEDRNFYKEGAFDVPRIVKAVVIDAILRRPAQGASTITQQLAKQAFFGPNAEKSPLRKVREALLASEIDSTYSKQQVLEKYLNLIYYGEDAYGIENASERFFGKHASDLNLREATLLAGLPNAPSADDPYQNPQGAYSRMDYVLTSMVATGNISQAQADAVDPLASNSTVALQNQQALLAELKNGHADLIGPAPHFAQYVQNQLSQLFADDPTVLSGTLTVTTTLDLTSQGKANAAIDKGLPKLGPSANNSALLMLDSHTGDILAMVGSADFTNNQIAGQYNVVTALRRPGSSFKPYVYEEAFRTGTITPGTTLNDTAAEAATVGGTHDWDNRYMGDMSAAKALLLSRNVPAEQTMVKVGIPQVIDFAHQLGITSTLSDNVSTAIGASDVTMIDQASAYSAFSNGGHKVVARAILKVVDENGNVLLDNTQPPSQGDVMTPAEAYTITNILVHYPSVWGVHFNMPVAAKSGTTDNTVDAYYMSYTPDVVVAAWAGHTEADNPAEIPMNNVYGTYVGQFISAPFMNSLGLANKPFTPVPGAIGDCGTTDQNSFAGINFGCPTPTPAPTPTPTMSPTSSPCLITPSPSLTNSPTPLLSLVPSLTPTPSASLVPTPTAIC